MQKYSLIVKIPVPIYESSVILSYNHTDEEIIELIENNEDYINTNSKEGFVKWIKDYDKPFAGLHITNDFNHLIRIAEMENQKELVNTVAHELLHYLSSMLRFRGLHLTEETEESYCYLQGYLMEEVYEKFIYEIITNQK